MKKNSKRTLTRREREILREKDFKSSMELAEKGTKVLKFLCSIRCLGFLVHPRRKIRLIEGNTKFRHLKKLTCKGTLRQVFIRVYRLEIQVSHVGIFDTAL
jgi:hypothetical protein